MQVSNTTLLGWTLLGSKGRHTEHDRHGFHKLFVISLYISWFCHLSPVLKIMLRGRAKRNRSSRSPLGARGIHGILYQNQKKSLSLGLTNMGPYVPQNCEGLWHWSSWGTIHTWVRTSMYVYMRRMWLSPKRNSTTRYQATWHTWFINQIQRAPVKGVSIKFQE